MEFWDNYLDWEDHLAKTNGDGADLPPTDYASVFLQLRPGVRDPDDNPVETGKDAAELFAPDGPLNKLDPVFEPHEADLFVQAQVLSEVEMYVYLPRRVLEDEDLRETLETYFAIIDVGPYVRSESLGAREPFSLRKGLTRGGPIVGIIDDGIGFLNERFTHVNEAGEPTSRFAAFWLQAKEKEAPPDASRGRTARHAGIGRMIQQDDINQWLRAPDQSECSVYRQLCIDHLAYADHWPMLQAFSHGTAVLDIAAGADPASEDPYDAAIRDWDLIGVQIPPEAISDTSGSHFETFVVMGVRWIIATAKNLDPKPSRIIINISLGILAGPKDGTRFLEYQVAREVARHTDVEVVFAYGNNHRSRQVAYLELPRTAGDSQQKKRRRSSRASSGRNSATEQKSIEWRVPPDDFTSSHLEIHALGEGPSVEMVLPASVRIGLEAPDGTLLAPRTVAPGTAHTFTDAAGKEVARIYHVPGRMLTSAPTSRSRPAHLAISVAPTAVSVPGHLTAPAGGWTVTLEHDEESDVTYILQIQRDDTAPGYKTRGRQSYFDAPNAYAWDPETQDYSGLEPGCPISRNGTNSALTTISPAIGVPYAQIHTVGGVEGYQFGSLPRVARYSSAGAPWSGNGPTSCATSEQGRFLRGVLASGTFSSSTGYVSGTSVAAPQITRHRAEVASALTGLHVPANLPETSHRLGRTFLENSRGIRRRH